MTHSLCARISVAVSKRALAAALLGAAATLSGWQGLPGAPAFAQSAAPISIISHSATDTVDPLGATLKGRVHGSLLGITTLTGHVKGKPNNQARTVEVNPRTGEFIFRLFSYDMRDVQAVTVTFTASKNNNPVKSEFTFTPRPDVAARRLHLAISRLTYGYTPSLWADIQRRPDTQTKDKVADWLDDQISVVHDAEDETGIVKRYRKDILYNEGMQVYEFRHSRLFDRLLMAAYGADQFRHVMAEAWANHFRTMDRGAFYYASVGKYREFEKYRTHAFDTFQKLLFTSAKNGVMMGYLHNDTNRMYRGRWAGNEDYARELLELHTVTPAAQYTNTDISEVARIFSGWTGEAVRSTTFSFPDYVDGAGRTRFGNDIVFSYVPENHDNEPKTIEFLTSVNGGQPYKVTGGGHMEGERLLTVLANHDLTKKNVCKKISQILVSDNAPAWSTSACFSAWGDTGNVGDLVRAVVNHPNYGVGDHFNNKIKTPYEFAIGFVRNFGLRPKSSNPRAMFSRIDRLMRAAGQDMTGFELPTGFPEVRDAWLGSSGFVARINAVTELLYYDAEIDYGNIPGVTRTDQGGVVSPAAATAEEAAAKLLSFVTNDVYSQEEFNVLVSTLKNPEGGFADPSGNRSLLDRAKRAVQLVAAMPSYQLQ